MPVTPRSWIATCNHRNADQSFCAESITCDDYNELRRIMAQRLWQYGVSKEGRPVKTNNSYCPAHRRPQP